MGTEELFAQNNGNRSAKLLMKFGILIKEYINFGDIQTKLSNLTTHICTA